MNTGEAYRDQIIGGDALRVLRGLPEGIVQSCVTSPPYYGLRDYGTESLIWDGDSDCEHQWGEPLRTPWANEVSGPNGIQKNTVAGHWKPKETGPFCQTCGAWRGSLGLEPTPMLFIQHLVHLFREVRRVLRDDGTLWVNIGDSYAGSWGNYAPGGIKGQQRLRTEEGERWERRAYQDTKFFPPGANPARFGLKNKDLMMIPARLAIALQEDGWWLRSDIIWHKLTAMPESVLDRPTCAHEHVFLLSKSERYFYDTDAVRQPLRPKTFTTFGIPHHPQGNDALGKVKSDNWGSTVVERQPKLMADGQIAGANLRNVWPLASQPFSEAHFATMPPKLVEPCILAGTPPKTCEYCGAPWKRVTEPTGEIDHRESAHVPNNSPTKIDSTGWKRTRRATNTWQPTCACKNEGTGKSLVLDPFMGAGTVALVARQHQRSYLGIELNPAYIQLIEDRIAAVQPNLWDTPIDEVGEQELGAWGHVLSALVPDEEEWVQ